MSSQEISVETVRALMLSAQGLLHPPARNAVKEDVFSAIDRVGLLQIDTINVVARAPYLAIWSRLGEYDPAWLEDLLAEGQIFEYWAHAACFIPIDQYRYHRRMMLDQVRYHRYREWYLDHQADTDKILEHIQQHGAVRSADFERKDGKKGTWWDWKIEKDALEYWLAAGDVMVSRREKFQRVYDLRERVHPAWEDSDAAAYDESMRYFVLRSIQAMGVAKPEWIPDYYRISKADAAAAVRSLLEDGVISEIRVTGWPEPALISRECLALLNDSSADLRPTLTTLLCPFDSLIWDRKRTRELFNYDFSIECYLPQAKRKYGYYLLSALYRGQIVARLDVKAHRQQGAFEVKALYWEPDLQVTDEMRTEVLAAVQRCADWHRTPELRLPDSLA
jgi:uncharacterized protein YcaQ